jgi:hypothetical protein
VSHLRLADRNPRTGALSPESLRLGYATKSDSVRRMYALDLALPRSAAARLVAEDLIRRAAIFKLTHCRSLSPACSRKVVRATEPDRDP